MTKLLEQAFTEAAKLPEAEQEALAAWLLEELAAEKRWEDSLRRSANVLADLADEALAEHHAHRTVELDLDRR